MQNKITIMVLGKATQVTELPEHLKDTCTDKSHKTLYEDEKTKCIRCFVCNKKIMVG